MTVCYGLQWISSEHVLMRNNEYIYNFNILDFYQIANFAKKKWVMYFQIWVTSKLIKR